ncbi:MAG: 50S ribosomal protein L19 [Bdellovibrionaceae bacterium]|nr:50S ribosomal protein L19 [Bdellovibrionales bacterium]MCB9254810.1 50S ribosomal protein L19 [Pseudobdellovibrionaceae bacterium]
MQNPILDKISKSFEKKRPNFHVGDTVTVYVRLKEGDKERVQPFRGVVLSKSPKSGRGAAATFTVRKISEGIGVERIFPLHSPFVEKINVETSADIRKSRLYFLRGLRGKKARLKEMERFAEMVVPEAAVPAPEELVTETVEAAADAEAPKAEAKEAKTEAKDAKPSKDSK